MPGCTPSFFNVNDHDCDTGLDMRLVQKSLLDNNSTKKNLCEYQISLNPNAKVFTFQVAMCSTSSTTLTVMNSESVMIKKTRKSQQIKSKENKEDLTSLKCLRLNNPNKILIAQLNINSIRNKIDALVNVVQGVVDVLLISDSKIDSSFPIGQFRISGYSCPYRKDRNENGVEFYYM